MKKFILALLILSVSLGFVYLYKTEPKQKKKIKVVYQEEGMYPSFLLDITEDKKIFDKEGIELERIPSLDAVDKVLYSGQADVGIIPTLFFAGYLNGRDMVWLSDYQSYQLDYLVSRYPKEEIEKIKKVGIKRLVSGDEYKIKKAVETLGGNRNELEMVVAAGGNIKIEYLKKGRIDAMLLPDYFIAQKQAKENGFYLIDMKEIREKDYSGFHVATLRKNLDLKKESLAKFVGSLEEGKKFVLKNQGETKLYLQNKYKIDEQKADYIYQELKAALVNTEKPSLDNLQPHWELIKEIANPKNPRSDLSHLIDESFLKLY